MTATDTAYGAWDGYHAAPARRVDVANSAFAAALLFALAAISHIVMREPAPYDLMIVGIAGILFALGLRIPQGIALPAVALVLILVGYMIGGFGARYIDLSVKFLRTSAFLSATFVFFAAIVAASPDRGLRALWGGYIVAGLCAAGLGIGGYLGFLPVDPFAAGGRAKALFQDPNVYGPFLVAPILYAVWRMTTVRAASALFFWGPIATVMTLGLFLSFSRGAWAHLALSGLVMVVLALLAPETSRQRGRIALIAVVLGVMLTLALGWALTVPEIREMFDQRFGLQSYDVRQGGRFSGQLEALKTALVNPFGIGPNNWGMIAGADTHNVYLNVFVSGGFISLVGWLALIAVTLSCGMRYALHGARRGVFIVALATLIGIFAEGIIVDVNHWRHMYLLLGMVWGLMLALPPDTQRAGN